MIDTIIIMVGVCISVALLSKADIKITVTKRNDGVVERMPEKGYSTDEMQKLIDDESNKSVQPTFDDLVKEVQNILNGGDVDAE